MEMQITREWDHELEVGKLSARCSLFLGPFMEVSGIGRKWNRAPARESWEGIRSEEVLASPLCRAR
jgi:hypothetical protein